MYNLSSDTEILTKKATQNFLQEPINTKLHLTRNQNFTTSNEISNVTKLDQLKNTKQHTIKTKK